MINTIKATSEAGSEGNKPDVYLLLNMIHVMAGRCAVAKIDNWGLKSTCTMEDYVMTTWTNGIVNIVAESYPFEDEHIYTLKDCNGVINEG